MAKTILALSPSGAHFSFTASLGQQYRFQLNWLTTYRYFVVTVTDGTGKRLTSGRGLHVGSNIMSECRGFSGTLKIEGSTPTPANLGVDNQLVWEH